MAQLTLEGLIGATDEVTTSFVAQVFPDLAELVSPAVYLIAVAYWAKCSGSRSTTASHQVLGSGAKDVPHCHGVLTELVYGRACVLPGMGRFHRIHCRENL